MPTSSKRTSKPPAKRTTKRSVKPAPPAAIPFLRFYHSDGLRARTLLVLTTIEQARDSTRYRHALSDLVMELTDSGLEYYYLRPLRLARIGFVAEQSVRLGIGGVKQVMAPIVHSIIGHMDTPQLLAICSHIRQLME